MSDHKATIPDDGKVTMPWHDDLTGVLDLTRLWVMKRVEANPVRGQYVFDLGAYTFSAEDVGHEIAIPDRSPMPPWLRDTIFGEGE